MSWYIKEIAEHREHGFYSLSEEERKYIFDNIEKEVGSGPHDVTGKIIKVGDMVAAGVLYLDSVATILGTVTKVDSEKDKITVYLEYHPMKSVIGTKKSYNAFKRFVIVSNKDIK